MQWIGVHTGCCAASLLPLSSWDRSLAAALSLVFVLLSFTLCLRGCLLVSPMLSLGSKAGWPSVGASRPEHAVVSGNIEFANCSALKLLQYELKELVGTSLEAITTNATQVMAAAGCHCCSRSPSRIVAKGGAVTDSKILMSRWVKLESGQRYLVLLLQSHYHEDMNVITRCGVLRRRQSGTDTASRSGETLRSVPAACAHCCMITICALCCDCRLLVPKAREIFPHILSRWVGLFDGLASVLVCFAPPPPCASAALF